MINAKLNRCKGLPMRIIRSSSNPRIQQVRKLVKDRKKDLFIVEGKKLFQEALASNIQLKETFVTPEFWTREKGWLENLEREGVEILLITQKLLKSISDVESPQGILGVVRRPGFQSDLALTGFAVFLVSIRDPGNFGTIVRTAEACGCEWISYSADCVDPFQPKTVRASMGSLFRVPSIQINDPVVFLRNQIQRKTLVYGLETRGTRSMLEWRPQSPFIVCIGSESHGLRADLPLTERIFIPMKGQVESLNAAVAAAVCLYFIRFFHNA